MKLHWSPRSPFVRKVMIVLHETGLTDQVDRVRSLVAMPLAPSEEILADNPLGKIPALVTEEGMALIDSRVICEYLDLRAATNLFPKDSGARAEQLTWQALGDGLTDILLLWRTELARDGGPWQAVTDGWLTKVRATMARLEAEAPTLKAAEFGIGHVAIICALGQMDFRWPDCDWRVAFPALADWEKDVSRRPSVRDNAVINDQGDSGTEITAERLTFPV